MGKKKQPTYRIVVQEKSKDPWGKSAEILGNYNPRAKENALTVKEDRVKHWIQMGAKPSATVHNLLVDAKIVPGPKMKNTTKDLKPQEAPEAPAEQAPAEGATKDEKKAE